MTDPKVILYLEQAPKAKTILALHLSIHQAIAHDIHAETGTITACLHQPM